MSEVLIKGMKMPKSCPCELVGVGYDMHCTFAYGVPSRVREYYECCEKETRPEWCPITEVPTPHGRLVDCDEVFQRLKRFSIANPYLQEQIDSDLCALVRWFGTAPTIIEEDGE